jgi:predicted nucleotidyltransferase
MLDKGTVVNTVERYADAVKEEFSPFAVVLFGSYAKGDANDESDIDVGVIFKGFNGDWLKTSSRLWHLAYDISWDIEPHLLDTTQDKSGFVKHVFKTGRVIYQA